MCQLMTGRGRPILRTMPPLARWISGSPRPPGQRPLPTRCCGSSTPSVMPQGRQRIDRWRRPLAGTEAAAVGGVSCAPARPHRPDQEPLQAPRSAAARSRPMPQAGLQPLPLLVGSPLPRARHCTGIQPLHTSQHKAVQCTLTISLRRDPGPVRVRPAPRRAQGVLGGVPVRRLVSGQAGRSRLRPAGGAHPSAGARNLRRGQQGMAGGLGVPLRPRKGSSGALCGWVGRRGPPLAARTSTPSSLYRAWR